jgi:protein-tyrosine-phosphatase
MRTIVIGLVSSAALAVAAGCGGSGGDRLSREELVSEADAICTQYEDELESLAQPENIQDLDRLVEDAKPIVESGLEELRGLEPPEDLEDPYDEWISRTEENVDRLDELGEAVADRDEQRIGEVVGEIQQTEEEADELAGEIGLQECASD